MVVSILVGSHLINWPVVLWIPNLVHFVIYSTKLNGWVSGLNCAEAVNFAPADWLPHGGVGADLYRLYRKAAVLSHEELLCVAVKVDFIVTLLMLFFMLLTLERLVNFEYV